MAGQTSILTSAPQALSTGRIPFWLRQKSLVSVSAHTLRPGGLTLTRHAVELCDFTSKARILDAGCGYGMTLEYLYDSHGITGTGIDPDTRIIPRTRHKLCSKARLFRGALPSLPFLSATWDGIFCECVLSLAENPEAWLSECHRLLAVNGKLVITDLYIRKWTPPIQRNPPGNGGSRTCAEGARPLMEMMTGIENAGFKIDMVEDHTGLLSQLGMPRRDSKTGYAMIIAGKYN